MRDRVTALLTEALQQAYVTLNFRRSQLFQPAFYLGNGVGSDPAERCLCRHSWCHPYRQSIQLPSSRGQR